MSIKILALTFVVVMIVSCAAPSIAVDNQSSANNTTNQPFKKALTENASPSTASSSSNTIYVPDDYEKIQWAVDNASAGDTIIVRDGIYTENVNVNKSHLTIQSENGSDNCIVQAVNPSYHVFEISADYVTISGFTVTGATGSIPFSNGIYLNYADFCAISYNNCTSNKYEGIFLSNSNNCNVSSNRCSSNTHGIALSYSNNNTLSNNNCSLNYDGISLSLSYTNYISNNICLYSERNGIISWYSSNNELTNNILVENGLVLYGYAVNDYPNDIDESNTVNGKPIYYWNGIDGGRIPDGAGQVILVNCTNVTIENQNLNNASIGIQIYFSFDINIKNNSCFNNKYPDDAIRLRYSDDCTISDNNCFDNHHGVDLLLSNNNRISNNNISSNYRGISIQSSNSTYINNNILSGNDDEGIYFHNCYRSNITNNFFRNNLMAICMYHSYGNSINLNDIDTTSIGFAGSNQIYLRYSCNNIILDNILNNYSGLYIDYSSNNNVLTNNKITNATTGISLRNAQFNILNKNNISDSNGGIILIGSSHNTLINNTITLNRAGIEVFSSYYGNYGYNTIVDNNICCNDIGISISGVLPAIPEPNTIYHNDFINNKQQAYDNIGNNSWDNGYPFGGNYYSDYFGVDLKRGPNQDQPGNDGIGDTPYPIPGNSSVDRYPFVQSVAQSEKENLIKSIDDLRIAMLYKIDWDVSRTADTFTYVRGYQLSKKWADIFDPGLKILEGAIQIFSIPQKLLEFITDPNNAWIRFKSSLDVISFALMLQGLERSGENFYTGLYGPPYAAAVKDMIKSADATFFPIELNFNSVSYQMHIKNDLVRPRSYGQSPLLIPRKSGDISRKTIGSSNGAFDATRSINKEFYILINDIRFNDLPADFQTEKVISELNELKDEIYISCNQNVTAKYDTYLLDKGDYIPKRVEINMGSPAQYSKLFVELCNNLDKKLSLEYNVTIINAFEATNVLITSKIPSVGKVIDIPLTFFSVGGIKSELDILILYSTVEDEFYLLPQEMLMCVPLESSNLWMVADDINRYLRYQLGILEPPIKGVDEIYAHFGSPGELRVCDSQSRVTGLVNGAVVEEIPYSSYYQNTVSILFPTGSYCYEIAGTENGTYTLDITSIANSAKSYFSVANISIQNDWKHQYPINWTNFSTGEEVFMVRKDENGDGIFEENVTIIPPVANFTHVPEGPVTYQSITFNASSSSDSDGFIKEYFWTFGDGNSGEGLVISHSYSLPGDYNVILVVSDNDGTIDIMGKTITIDPSFLDTYSRANPHPSISGTHNGTVTPSCNITVSKLYTYPCPGTGGHAEYAKISNESWSIETLPWTGYTGDWHNISFNNPFTLYANETYNYTIRTGSYPQIIHEREFNATGGVITCTSFMDLNGNIYDDWIPAIRLF